MKKKQMSRLVAFLLTLVMMVGMMPTTVHATPTLLTLLSATVTEPVAGATPATTVTSGDSDKYTVEVRRWFKGGSTSSSGPIMEDSETFAAGETYILSLNFTPKAGYTFGDATKATINNNSPSGRISYNTITGAYEFRIAFTIPAAFGFPNGADYDIPAGVVGTTYTVPTALAATGGTAPYTFTIDGTVPAGLSINSDNKLVYARPSTVTPATTATIKVTDSSSTPESKTITIAIGEAIAFGFPDGADYDIPEGMVGTTYTMPTALAATGGTAPYTFTIDGAVPAGLSINSDNKLVYARPSSVTPATTATIKVTDSSSTPMTATINIAIGAVTPTLVTDVSATVTEPVAGATPATTVTSGDSDKYTVEVRRWFKGGSTSMLGPIMEDSETFAAGETYILSLNFTPKAGYTFGGATKATINNNSPSGRISSNTITGASEFRIVFTIPAAFGFPNGADYDIPAGVVGTTYTVPTALAATGGTAPYNFTIDGTVPAGLSINSDNKLVYARPSTVTPATTATIKVTDSSSTPESKTITIAIGEVTAAAHVHTPETKWSFDTVSHWHACSGCDELLDKAIHTYGEWTVTTPATETTKGEKQRTCSVCGAVEKAEIPVIGHVHTPATEWSFDTVSHWHACTGCTDPLDKAAHTYGEWTVTTPATETTKGEKQRTCSVCGAIEKAEIPVIGHVHIPATEWSSDAANHWHTCTGCSELLDKAAHTYGEWTVTTPATETTKGEKQRTCSVCGAVEKAEIPVIGHVHIPATEWSFDTVSHWHACTGCTDPLDKAAHTYGEWTVTTPATETTKGEKQRTCSVCGAVEKAVIWELNHIHTPATEWSFDTDNHWHTCTGCADPLDKAAHTYGEWTVTTPATETTKGEKQRTCSVCGAVEKAEIPITSMPVIKGDVNNDGKITLADAQMTLKAALGIIKLTETKEKAADVDGKEGITLSDAQIVLKAALYIIVLK